MKQTSFSSKKIIQPGFHQKNLCTESFLKQGFNKVANYLLQYEHKQPTLSKTKKEMLLASFSDYYCDAIAEKNALTLTSPV